MQKHYDCDYDYEYDRKNKVHALSLRLNPNKLYNLLPKWMINCFNFKERVGLLAIPIGILDIYYFVLFNSIIVELVITESNQPFSCLNVKMFMMLNSTNDVMIQNIYVFTSHKITYVCTDSFGMATKDFLGRKTLFLWAFVVALIHGIKPLCTIDSYSDKLKFSKLMSFNMNE